MSVKEASDLYYIERFEDNFEEWIEGLSRIVASGGDLKDLKSPVQAVVNAYHDVKGGLSPVDVRNLNTLKLFVLVSGASENHSGSYESLNMQENLNNRD
jgi:hypothetical protein